MSHQNHFGQKAFDLRVVTGLMGGTMIKTLAATFVMDADATLISCLDPGGAGRDVLLPPEEDGLILIIVNDADAAEDLVVKEDAGVTTIGTISQNEFAILVCVRDVWRIMVSKTT